ncbi:RICIN domain-containing protein [Streptomyces sp. NPDC002870]|uniref:RICIN domain-containing protein n=1 Tax=Streptomyces sp. NPDC002870 TaxID=3364666 RepID=UPI0036795A62
MHSQRPGGRDAAGFLRPGRSRRLRALVSVLATFLMVCGVITATSGTAQAAPPDTHRPATWNMNQSRDHWAAAYDISRTHDVVALQETPSTPPEGARRLGRSNGITQYAWQPSDREPVRYLFILEHHTRNLGMITAWAPDRVLNIPGRYRPMLGVVNQRDDILFASLHAAAGRIDPPNWPGGGSDSGSILRRVRDAAAEENMNHWAAIGDFNRSPSTLRTLEPPAESVVYNPGQPTHRLGGEYDWMVANFTTEQWQATVETGRGSDHWPVYFGSLRAGSLPAEFEIHSETSHLLLTNHASGTANGTGIEQNVALDDGTRRWALEPADGESQDGKPLYKLVHTKTGKCLDVRGGHDSEPGTPLHLWDCHGPNGWPEPGGPRRDTQNVVLEHPDPMFPNMTVLRLNGTREYVAIPHNDPRPGAPVAQDRRRWGPNGGFADNETFYFHPCSTTARHPTPPEHSTHRCLPGRPTGQAPSPSSSMTATSDYQCGDHVLLENRDDLGRSPALSRRAHALQAHPLDGYEITSPQPTPQPSRLGRRQHHTQRLDHHGSPSRQLANPSRTSGFLPSAIRDSANPRDSVDARAQGVVHSTGPAGVGASTCGASPRICKQSRAAVAPAPPLLTKGRPVGAAACTNVQRPPWGIVA